VRVYVYRVVGSGEMREGQDSVGVFEKGQIIGRRDWVEMKSSLILRGIFLCDRNGRDPQTSDVGLRNRPACGTPPFLVEHLQLGEAARKPGL